MEILPHYDSRLQGLVVAQKQSRVYVFVFEIELVILFQDHFNLKKTMKKTQIYFTGTSLTIYCTTKVIPTS